MPIQKRRPLKPISFPPTAPMPRGQYQYASNGSWTLNRREKLGEISARYGFPDPWDVILYNFQVRNPAEVNWALNYYQGCTKTLDNTNYCLDPSDRYPVFFIPPVGFKAFKPADETARSLILDTLNRSDVMNLQFRLADLPVDGTLFEAVKSRVWVRTILALSTTAAEMPTVRALYNPVLNYIQVRDPAVVDAGKRATIVHECVHAGMDVRRLGGDVLRHEAAAHVAEALFYAVQHGDPTTAINPGAIPEAHARAAMVIALRIWQHNQANVDPIDIGSWDAQYLILRWALSLVPQYGSRAHVDIGSNGV